MTANTTPPDISHGVLIGLGDWRLSVEAFLPDDPASVWGTPTWGAGTWTELVWVDLTDRVRGVEWRRGSDNPHSRPRIGEASLTLANLDRAISPLQTAASSLASPSMWAPGLLMRFGLRSPTSTVGGGWLPQFTGVVESWVERSNAADSWVEVQLFETMRLLSEIDGNALTSMVGDDDTAATRVGRLLSAAGWEFGLVVDNIDHEDPTSTAYPYRRLQSTDMASNRLAEIYVAADSANLVVRTARDGRVMVHHPNLWHFEAFGVDVYDPNPDLWPLMDVSTATYFGNTSIPFIGFDGAGSYTVASGVFGFQGGQMVPYNRDSFEMSTDADFVANDVRFARVGGTQQVAEWGPSIAKFGRRTYSRSDLMLKDDVDVAGVATYVLARRAMTSYRVENVTVETSNRDPDTYLAVVAADIGCWAAVNAPGTQTLDPFIPTAYVTGWVRSMVHRVTWVGGPAGRVLWQTEFAFDTDRVHNVPGAQADE